MKELKRFSELITKLQSTMGRLEKEAYLREVAEDKKVLEILKFLFDPYVVSGISDKKLAKAKKAKYEELPLLTYSVTPDGAPPISLKGEHAEFLTALAYFRKNNTGRDEDVRYLIDVAKNSEHEELVYSIIKKDLKLGIQGKTLNKVFGANFVPKFDVMLAESYNDNREFVEGKEFIVTEKFDGVRCVLIFNEEGIPTFFSRQGQAIVDLVELAEQVKYLPKNYVFDGELLLENKNNLPSEDLYRATVKVTSSDGKKRGIYYNIFDMVDKKAFRRGSDPTPAIKRKMLLRGLLLSLADKCPNLVEVKMQYVGTDTAKIEELMRRFTENGGEGIMLNIAGGAYQCKRTKNLLKVKQFNTADVEVLSLEEGTGANRGKLGAVVVRFFGSDGKHYTCRVGSGFKLDERERFWVQPELIRGKIIEIGYFELSKNQNNDDYSLRFPTFKHVRNDKTEISMH